MYPTPLLIAQPLLSGIDGPKTEKMEDIAPGESKGGYKGISHAVVPIFQSPLHVSHSSNKPNAFTFLCQSISISHYFFKFFTIRDLTSIVNVMARSLSSSSSIWEKCLLSELATHTSSLTAIQKTGALINAIFYSKCSCNSDSNNREMVICFKKNRQYFYDFIGLFVTRNNAKYLYEEIGKFVNRMIYHPYWKEKIRWNIFRGDEDCPLLTKTLLIFRWIARRCEKNMTSDQLCALSHHVWSTLSVLLKNHYNDRVLTWLIASGIDLNIPSSTPLMEAAVSGPVSIVRELIAAKANVNAANCAGETPLFYAVEGHARDRTSIVRELIAAKANVNMQAWYGKTVLVPTLRRMEAKECMLLLAYQEHTHVVANCVVACLMGFGEGCCEGLL